MTLPKGTIKHINNDDISKAPFLIFQSDQDDYHKFSKKSRSHETDCLGKFFFHPKNIDNLQKQIIKKVFVETKGDYLIEKQNEMDLLVVMRSIFLQNHELPRGLKLQIEYLNNLVLIQVVPEIITNVLMYVGYLEKINNPVEIMERPLNVSNTGLKTLPSVTKWLN